MKTPVPMPKWVVKGFIPGGESIVWVSGPPKEGYKSFFCWVAAKVAASGKPYKLLSPGGEPRKTAFIYEEGNEFFIKRRIRKVELSCFQEDRWKSNGKDGSGVVHVLPKPKIKLDDHGMARELAAVVKEHSFELVFLDPVTYMHSGDENNRRDMMRLIDGINLIKETGCTIVGIIHITKESRRLGTNVDMDLGMRGSSLLIDTYDSHVAMRVDPETHELYCFTRHREGEPGEYKLKWEIDACKEDEPHNNWDEKCISWECFNRHPCSTLHCQHGLRFHMEKSGSKTRAKDLFLGRVEDHFMVGEFHTVKSLRDHLRVTHGAAIEYLNSWEDQGLVERDLQGKSWRIL
jgi:hypothetical protein